MSIIRDYEGEGADVSPPDSQSLLFHRCEKLQGGSSCRLRQRAASRLTLAGMPAAEGLLFTGLGENVLQSTGTK